MIDAIYIHVPFCEKKCYYCDFLSYKADEGDIEKYFEYILKEIYLHSNDKYDTIYFGGGTPSIVATKHIKKILEHLPRKKNAEISIEVNPNSVTYKKLSEYKNIGINRLSIGCQSFQDETLKRLGRNHNKDAILSTYNDALKAGFSNISIDLIFAVPGQSIQTLNKDLDMIKKLSPQHISIYSLMWKEGTKFYDLLQSDKIKEIDEDLEADMYELIINRLKQMGYIHYEISSFSKNNYFSRHNLKYWENKYYIGVGQGASGYIEGLRYRNCNDLSEYYKKIDDKILPYDETETIDKSKKEEYKNILGLRLLEQGVEISKEYQKIAEKLIVSGFLIRKDNNNLVLTKKGLFLANEVFMEFLNE